MPCEIVELVEQLPSSAEYNRLRIAVGWRTYDHEAIARCLPRSLYCLCALQDGELIGMARIVGDGELVCYIQDVCVLPAYQRQGIGRRLMDGIMAYLAEHAAPNTIVGLMSGPGKEPFYEGYGFVRRPNERQGHGMQLPYDKSAAASEGV
jgi:GNAT superfamily N-acetyltransferase